MGPILNLLRGRPLFTQYAITQRCNSRCLSCEYWRKQAQLKELTFEEMSHLADELWHFGIRILTVTGGEPFLRDDAPEIIRLFQKRGFRVTINTNGTCIDKTLVKELSRMKRLHIVISLDSLDRKVYARIRGIDALDAVLEAMSILKHHTPHSIRAFTIVSSDNYGEVPQILRFCREKGYALSVYPSMTGTKGRWFTRNKLIQLEERRQIAKVFDGLSELSKRDRTLFGFSEAYRGSASFLRGEPPRECGAGKRVLQVSPDGTISACPEMEPFCDIRKECLSAAYGRKRWREEVQHCYTTTPCYIGCTRMLQSISNSPVRFLAEMTSKHLKGGKYGNTSDERPLLARFHLRTWRILP